MKLNLIFIFHVISKNLFLFYDTTNILTVFKLILKLLSVKTELNFCLRYLVTQPTKSIDLFLTDNKLTNVSFSVLINS